MSMRLSRSIVGEAEAEAVRRVINVGLARSGLTGKDLDRRNIINRNTLVKRKAEGETIRLGEIWALDRVLHFTDDEILQMFGRERK